MPPWKEWSLICCEKAPPFSDIEVSITVTVGSWFCNLLGLDDVNVDEKYEG